MFLVLNKSSEQVFILVQSTNKFEHLSSYVFSQAFQALDNNNQYSEHVITREIATILKSIDKKIHDWFGIHNLAHEIEHLL